MVKNKVNMKTKQIGNIQDAQMIQDMFNQMTGVSNADMEVIIPKYANVLKYLNNYKLVLNILFNHNNLWNLDESLLETKLEISDFINKLNHLLEEEKYDSDIESRFLNHYYKISMSKDLEKKTRDKELEKLIKQFNQKYTNFKSNELIKQIIISTNNLTSHKKFLIKENKNEDELSFNSRSKFIHREPGLVLYPFHFTKLDLKYIWSFENLSHKDKILILDILEKLYLIGFKIYDIIESPDIDIKKFSHLIIDNLGNIQKEIPRCDQAFNIIKKSVEMLETNFKRYYKESVESDNPNIIFESFLSDIMTSQKTNNNKLINQFRRIIMHIQKKNNSIKDPNAQKIFNMLGEQMTNLNSQLKKNNNDNNIKTRND